MKEKHRSILTLMNGLKVSGVPNLEWPLTIISSAPAPQPSQVVLASTIVTGHSTSTVSSWLLKWIASFSAAWKRSKRVRLVGMLGSKGVV